MSSPSVELEHLPKRLTTHNGAEPSREIGRLLEGVSSEQRARRCRHRVQRPSARRRDLRHPSQVSSRELQARRIHDSSAHEAAGLASAAARIGGIREAAFALHEALKLAPRAGEQLPEALPRRVEQLGAGGIVRLEYLAQHESQALRAIEAEQGAATPECGNSLVVSMT